VSARRRLVAAAALLCLTCVPLAAGAGEPSPERDPAATDPPAPRVEIYTSAGCTYCRMLKVYLGARGIEYTEHNVNATLETQAAFRAMGGYGTPVVVIDGQLIQGFDPPKLEAALEAARHH
jgi:glutaredoxin